MLHLLHPAAVHFSVAFLVAGGLGESFGILLRRPGVERWSGTLVLLGTLSLFPTVVTGFLAENVLRPSEDLASLLALHERMGLVVLGTFLALLLWKAWRGGAVPDSQRLAFALALLAAVGLVLYAAVLGGSMVYGWGLGVGPS
jgi:uncharacterized membrane protein